MTSLGDYCLNNCHEFCLKLSYEYTSPYKKIYFSDGFDDKLEAQFLVPIISAIQHYV